VHPTAEATTIATPTPKIAAEVARIGPSQPFLDIAPVPCCRERAKALRQSLHAGITQAFQQQQAGLEPKPVGRVKALVQAPEALQGHLKELRLGLPGLLEGLHQLEHAPARSQRVAHAVDGDQWLSGTDGRKHQ